MKKLKVAILFGGKSAEHEVSVQSAKNIYHSLNKNKYDVEVIGIDKKGLWHKLPAGYLLQASFSKQLPIMHTEKTFSITDAPLHEIFTQDTVVFPVLHGPFGEDGSMQGLLKQLDV